MFPHLFSKALWQLGHCFYDVAMRYWGMSKVRIRQFRRLVSALAILGALLNVWVLTGHTTSVILAQLHSTSGDAVVICHQGGKTEGQGTSTPDKRPAQNKSCPICSGLASLHLAIVSQPLLLTASTSRGATVVIAYAALVLDHRPREILNRGPPLLA
jgi:hypothetical protein